MDFGFDHAIDRKGTTSVKWFRPALESICGNPDAEAFWVADMDFPAEPHIKEAALKVAESGVFGYPAFTGLEETFVDWMERKHHVEVNKDDVVYGEGLLHALSLALQTFTKKHDRILVPSPTYRPFRMMCQDNDREMVDWPIPYENGIYTFDKVSFREAAKDCDAIMFCSPHNPSGLVFSKDELECVLKTAKELGIPVFSDEIHGDLVHPGAKHIPMYEANRKIGARAITFMAPSKTFNVAGEHSCFTLFSDVEMREEFKKAQKALHVVHPAYMIGTLAEAAYKYGLEYNEELCAYLKGNADMIREYLEKYIPELKLVNGKASFVTFIDCSEIYEKVKKITEGNPEKYKGGPDSGPLSLFFGVDAGVCFNNGRWFGDQYDNFVRINYGTSRENVRKALESMRKAVEAIR